jgi:hypothetical protein
VTERIGLKSALQQENAIACCQRLLDQGNFRSAHDGERSEILDKRECCSWEVSQIRPDHAGLREVSVELLVLHLVE